MTRVLVKPRLCDQNHRKNFTFTLGHAGLTRSEIEPESTVLVADALFPIHSTPGWMMIANRSLVLLRLLRP